MNVRWMALTLALPLIAAEPAGYRYWSAAELRGFAKTLAPKLDEHKIAVADKIIDQGSYFAAMVHREGGTGIAEMHQNWADVYMISSGSGTLVVGGTIPGGKDIAPGETRGPAVEGGTRQKLAAGDIVHIASKTPHNVLVEPGGQITYFILKVKE